MVEIIKDGSGFENICENASLIQGYKRDSYLLRYTKDGKSLILAAPLNGIIYTSGDMELLKDALEDVWYKNLKIGGISVLKEYEEEAKKILEEEFKGHVTLFSDSGDKVCYLFLEDRRKRALFAGGCFWCIASPYYSLKGVITVKAGYAGGLELNPSYLEVKHQLTHHRECILVEYNSLDVDYERILEVFFENIDPFDTEGQYIDRGESYSPAVFTSDKEERCRVIEYKYQLSDECERRCEIPLLDNVPFFMAEEEHQDYALKNKDAFLRELITSGRKKI